MFVYSGNYRLCECGLETQLVSINGEKFKTGDIVVTYHEDGILDYMAGLTVVVCDQWKSYTNGAHKLVKDYPDGLVNDAWIMGIRGSILGEKWQAEEVKSFEDVIDGEHWENFGFNFRKE